MTEPTPTSPVSPWVERFASLVPAGRSVLDLACGSGRHAAYFTGLGFRVTALDRDVSKLVPGTAAEVVEADLEGSDPWPLAGRRFDGIVVTNYLYRPLFPVLVASLNPGGALIYETFAVGNEKFGRPRNPDFLLREGELLEAVSGTLKIVAYEAGMVGGDNPAVVQRIAAVARQADAAPTPLPV